MKTFSSVSLCALALFALPLAACGGDESKKSGDDAAASTGDSAKGDAVDPNAVPERFWSATPIAGAQDVKAIRDAETMPTDVVVRGTLQDFGELATFKLVEDTLKDCNETGEEDHCPTPWDYCCEDPDALMRYTINVELLDEGDFPGAWKLEGFHGLDRLSEVIVSGKLVTDEAGNMRIAAEKIAMQ